MFLGKILISITVVFSVQAVAAANKTLQEHWKDVGLKFSMMDESLNSKFCYQNEKVFVACALTLNALLEKEKLNLVPVFRLEADKEFGPVKADFGMVKIVGSKTPAEGNTRELIKKTRSEKDLNQKQWTKLFLRHPSESVDVEKLTSWIKNMESFSTDESNMAAIAMNTFLSVIKDPHTSVLPTSYVEQERSEAGENYSGIGASMRKLRKGDKTVIVVESPMEGSPSFKAGLKADDIITHIDSISTEGKDFPDAVSLIRGPGGKAVTLTIQRNGQSMEIIIVRANISVPNVSSKMFTQTGRTFAYVKLNSFIKERGCEQVIQVIEGLEKEHAEALIFDLRDNGGGLVTQAVCVGDIFLDRNKVVMSTKALNPLYESSTHYTKTAKETTLPMVTLINSRSASASEIVSGALQDHWRSYLVGDRTFGKGTIQTQKMLSGGLLVMRETIGRFYLPSGRTNQIEGVIPDFQVYDNPNPTEDDKVSFREEDEYMAFSAEGIQWKQTRPEIISQIQQCLSEQGVAAKRYEDQLGGAIRPDYQTMVAEDVLGCVLKLNLQETESKDQGGTEIGNGIKLQRDTFNPKTTRRVKEENKLKPLPSMSIEDSSALT